MMPAAPPERQALLVHGEALHFAKPTTPAGWPASHLARSGGARYPGGQLAAKPQYNCTAFARQGRRRFNSPTAITSCHFAKPGNREFTVAEPDKAGSTTSRIATDEDWLLFLAVVIDLFSRQVGGLWSLHPVHDVKHRHQRAAWPGSRSATRRHKPAGVLFLVTEVASA
jgi:hypothetical protein